METVTFTCTVSSTAHQWMVPSLNISRSLIPADLGMTFTDIQFQFAIMSVRTGSITSTAVFNATEDLNGTLVLCRDGNLVLPDDQNRTINLRGEYMVIVYEIRITKHIRHQEIIMHAHIKYAGKTRVNARVQFINILQVCDKYIL